MGDFIVKSPQETIEVDMNRFPITTALSRYFFGIQDTKIGDFDQPFPKKTKKRRTVSFELKARRKRAYNKQYRQKKKNLQISS